MTDRYAVFGNPIGHSKSPAIHTAFATATGEDLTYEPILAPLDAFADAARAFMARGGRGANVTVPFKEDAFRLATRLSERARLAEAVNTLSFTSEGILGDNTDGAGLVRDLGHNLGVPLAGRRILLLGAGGAARGVIAPLLAQGPAGLHIANRSADKAVALARHFAPYAGAARLTGGGLDDLDGTYDVIINGTAASLAGELLPVPARCFAPDSFAYDMMYGAGDTLFLAFARALDVPTLRLADGLGMLVEQAAESFHIWRSVRPDTAPVLATLRAQLSA